MLSRTYLALLTISLVPVFAGCPSSVPATHADRGGNSTDRSPHLPDEADDPRAKEPAEVELSEPKGRIDDNGIFWFEVNYRFSKGLPRKHYKVTVHFPNTKNLCIKTMEAWELNEAGVIKDGIPLLEQPITTYEIEFAEADSPMNAYTRISNLAVGQMAQESATRNSNTATDAEASTRSEPQPAKNTEQPADSP